MGDYFHYLVPDPVLDDGKNTVDRMFIICAEEKLKIMVEVTQTTRNEREKFKTQTRQTLTKRRMFYRIK